jgi:hypothetical protein
MAAGLASATELESILKIDWRLGPDYPMGIQDAAVGEIFGHLVSAGGFTRHPLDILKQHPDAFGRDPAGSGFTALTFALDLAKEGGVWKRIVDIPGPARQGGAVATVNGQMYVMGGINYDAPYTYRDTYQLQHENGLWSWQRLTRCQLPWPVYGAGASTAVIGTRIYLLGTADYFRAPGEDGENFHSEAGRDSSPVGKANLMLDTEKLDNGWKRLADCPGLPQFDAAVAAANSKVYRLGGIYAPLGKPSYYNAVDSWVYDPAIDQWSRLPDMPDGSNRRALAFDNRYLILLAGYKYGETWRTDGTRTVTNDAGKFEKTVLVYDTKSNRLGKSNPLIEETSYPSATIVGNMIYTLGGEGGPRLIHPATLQVGTIRAIEK